VIKTIETIALKIITKATTIRNNDLSKSLTYITIKNYIAITIAVWRNNFHTARDHLIVQD
jgi:hypothetical protein